MTTTLITGLVVALLYVELTGLVPGGLVVPAYFAFCLNQPGRAAATLAAALLALGAMKLASRHLLLIGRRRFVFLLLLGALIAQVWALLWPAVFGGPLDLRVIGWVIPGLLANNLARQKFWPTLAGLVTASVLTYALAELIRMIFS